MLAASAASAGSYAAPGAPLDRPRAPRRGRRRRGRREMSRATCSSRAGSGIASPRAPAGKPVAVPALEDEPSASCVPEPKPSQLANRCATSQCSAKRLPGERQAASASAPRPSPRGPPAAGRRRRSRGGMPATSAGLPRVDERERRPRHDVVAVQLRRLVRVRGAAGGVQQRDVVGVARAPAPTRPRARRAGRRASRCAARARAAARCRGRSRARGRRPPRRLGPGARRAPPGDASRLFLRAAALRRAVQGPKQSLPARSTAAPAAQRVGCRRMEQRAR